MNLIKERGDIPEKYAQKNSESEITATLLIFRKRASLLFSGLMVFCEYEQENMKSVTLQDTTHSNLSVP